MSKPKNDIAWEQIFEKHKILEMLSQIIDTTRTIKELEISFSQANSFERMINLCELLKQKKFIIKEETIQNYNFDIDN